MGIIAGLIRNQEKDSLFAVFDAMINVQKHRAPVGDRAFFAEHGTVLGGINRYECKSLRGGEAASCSTGIHVFIDGIVLHENQHSASEAVMQAYNRCGLDFRTHLEGEFSCAVWDENARRLILARDPLGKKPLHFYCSTTEFIFSSEIKGILAAGVSRELDLVNFSDYFTLNNFPYPGTMFKDIFQVEPGGLVVYDDNGLRKIKYWSPNLSVDHTISFEDAVDQLSSLFEKAVKKRLYGKTPYSFLSGGMDSSAIVAFASKFSSDKIHAVSVGFEEEEANELDDAEAMAKHVGAIFHPVIVKPDSFFSMLETLVSHHDIPFSDTSAYPTYFAAQAGANFSDVILTGDGADQLMGGSSHYVHAVRNNQFAPRSAAKRGISGLLSKLFSATLSDPTPNLLSRAQRKFYRESMPAIHAAYDLRSYFPDIVKKYLFSDDLWNVHLANSPYRHPDRWFEVNRGNDDINKYLHADVEFYLTDDLMTKVDRMCMAHGLETLSPFLDTELVNFIYSLPGNYKVAIKGDNVITKAILRSMSDPYFPKRVAEKGKQGFGIPLKKWLKSGSGSFVKEILLDPITLNRQYFNKKSIINLVDVYLSGKSDYFYPSENSVCELIIFELWNRAYIDRESKLP